MDLGQIIDSLDEIVWVYNPGQKQLEFVSAGIQDILGVDASEVLKQPKLLLPLFEEGEPERCLKALGQCTTSLALEVKIKHHPRHRWLQIKAERRNIDGEVKIVGTAHDITLQKRTERSFARFTERYDKILQSALTGYVLINLEGYIVNCNSAFTKPLKLKMEDVMSRNFLDLVAKSTSDENWLEQIKASGKSKGEISLLDKDQSITPFEYAASIIQLFDRELIVLFLEDITKKKKIRDQLMRIMKHSEEVSRMKTSIMANVTHEIKSPIHRIQGISEIIKQEFNDPALADYLETIRTNGERVLKSLTALVEFSKLDSLIAKDHFKRLNPWDSVLEIEEEFVREAQNKGLEVSVSGNSPDVEILGDKFILQECWRILVGNAIKFSKEGKIDVSWKLCKESGNIEILVEDEGMGMNPEFMPKVFDPFTQESQGFNRSHEGLGLGLSIARRYVSSLGGNIDIQSRSDKGTKVSVLLPILEG